MYKFQQSKKQRKYCQGSVMDTVSPENIKTANEACSSFLLITSATLVLGHPFEKYEKHTH